MAKKILTLTNGYAIVKVVGAGTESIALADLLLPSEAPAKDLAGNPIPYKVGINFVQWAVGTSAEITRNSEKIVELVGSPGSINFAADLLTTDYTHADKDISIAIVGGGTVLVKLRKTAGYASKIEPEYFGQYDNPTKVGE